MSGKEEFSYGREEKREGYSTRGRVLGGYCAPEFVLWRHFCGQKASWEAGGLEPLDI